MLDENQVALAEPFALGEFAAGLGDGADILVPHDHRRVRRRMLVELDVGAADAADLHLHQRTVRRDVRHRVFADFGLARPGPDGRQHFLSHDVNLSVVWPGIAVRRTASLRSPMSRPSTPLLMIDL
jgi:hypothetical protein